MTALLRQYSILLTKRPVFVQCVTSGIIGGAGELVSQLLIERRSLAQYECRRTISFALHAGLFMAPVLNKWFHILEKIKYPNAKWAPFTRLAVDQFTFTPVINAIVLFNLGVLEGKSPPVAYKQMTRDWLHVTLTGTLFWPMVQALNFSLIPLRHRVNFVQLGGFIWSTYVAWKIHRGNLAH